MITYADPATAALLLPAPAAQPPSRHPFWHRSDPLVAVTRIDPGYALLKRHFPASWQALVRVKALIDSAASLELPAGVPRCMHQRRLAPLLRAAARELAGFAMAEDRGPAGDRGPAQGGSPAATQARAAALRLVLFAESGEWPPVTLQPPGPDEPWLYCGPLDTWAMRAARTPLALLLVSPRPDLQREPDAIDASLATVRAAVAAGLGGPVRSTIDPRPSMHITDLLLAGGVSSSGHKHFAHFFPLEAPASAVAGPEFTVVFSNVHASRLRRCSLELLRRHAPGRPVPDDDVLRASLTWFRGHDLAHFWRLPGAAGGGPGDELTAFERMTLEETYADLLGLLSAASLGRADALSRAYAAELLRYLSRECSYFADSAAAALTVGWLRASGVRPVIGTPLWLEAALPPLGRLGRVIHRILWEGKDHELHEVRAALGLGREFGASLSGLYASVATDIEYIFG